MFLCTFCTVNGGAVLWIILSFQLINKKIMPHGRIIWIGSRPEWLQIFDVLKEMLKPYISAYSDDFPVVGHYWPTCLESEKVLTFSNTAFLCKIENEVLVLVPDRALTTSKLIWMSEAEIVPLPELTMECIRNAMAQ